ncbi:hypothetical protein PVAND_003348 [Polypedilum vanderplanki]|uniref:Endonuclease/exonuclease/phosphatase domain-containing protein n=1 Tax=Polypedilum vanderplanki TaxID=319348 RepID=A0A9J6BU98_POLVA|nr:hypothetical protein PVAND_003348 [Polypedilum vanderplanki]
MLKTLIRVTITNKNNNATFCCLKHYYHREMKNQGISRFNSTNPWLKSQTDQNNSVDRDVLSNIRKWVPVDQTNSKLGFIFTVLNYNILSQELLECHSYLYQDNARSALKWNNRLYNIAGEIFKVNPSILCCQEVELKHLTQIQNRLSCMNYGMLFKKRTGEKPDGCAIFFKNNLFELIEEHNVEFEQPGIEILNRENVAIIAKLCLKADPSVQFLVSTTHLLYNPRRQDIRLAQIQILLAELDRHAQIIDSDGQKTYMPVIVTGDFNLTPNTAPYNLITSGTLNYANLSAKTLQFNKGSNQSNGRRLLPIKLGISDECQHFNKIKLYHSERNNTINFEEVELTNETVNHFQTGVLRHNFNFKSVYHQKSENYVSTFQDSWILVDYIFYSDESKKSNSVSLQLLNYLSLPTAEDCEKSNLRIPNTFSGSDHLSLAAQFKLCYSDDKKRNMRNDHAATKL